MTFAEKVGWAASFHWYRALADDDPLDLGEVRDWLTEHFGAASSGICSETIWRYSVFYNGRGATDVWIRDIDDALLFKIRWC